MNVVKSICINFTISMLLLSGTVYLTDQWRYLQPYMLLGSMLFIVYLFFLFETTVRVNTKLFFSSILFFISCLISSILNQDIYLFEGAIILFVMYLVLGIFYPAVIKGELLNKQLAYSFLVLHIPIITVPILISGIDQIPYRGIFYNSNSFGLITAAVCIVLFSILSTLIDNFIFQNKREVYKLIITLIILLGGFILLLYSNSRTGFLSVLAVVFIYFIIVIKKIVLKGKIKFNALVRALLLIVVLCVLIYILTANTGLDELMINTVITKMSDGADDDLSGRLGIWSMAINDMKPFGNGREYFAANSEGAHSTYISILGQYGVIPSILYLIFILIILYYSYIYLKENENDCYRYLPFYSTIAYISMSITEGMLFKVSMILVYCIIGIVSNKAKINNKVI